MRNIPFYENFVFWDSAYPRKEEDETVIYLRDIGWSCKIVSFYTLFNHGPTSQE